MRVKFAVAAALLVSALGIGSSPAGAYPRNVPPSLLSVLCDPINDQVQVVWSKDAGKPSFVDITINDVGSVLAIPGSRGSKGFWIIPGAQIHPSLTTFPEGSIATVVLIDRTGTVESNIDIDACD